MQQMGIRCLWMRGRICDCRWDSEILRIIGARNGIDRRGDRYGSGYGFISRTPEGVVIVPLPNQPAAGNAGTASQLTIEHHRSGVPEPGQ